MQNNWPINTFFIFYNFLVKLDVWKWDFVSIYNKVSFHLIFSSHFDSASTPPKMKNCLACVRAFVIVLLMFVWVSWIATFSSISVLMAPKLRPMSCSQLENVNQPRSDHPFVAQGTLLAIGIVFFLVATSVGTKKKWKTTILCQSLILTLVPFVAFLTIIFGHLINSVRQWHPPSSIPADLIPQLTNCVGKTFLARLSSP